MGSFGERILSLVDTYSRCLAFLKLSRRASQLGEANSGSDSSSVLEVALRKSKTRVWKTYSSRLSRGGRSFEKGDATSRGSLRRIIRKLTATLARIQGSFTSARSSRQSPGVDYASLVSLCESSSADALRTMTDLSRRISTTSLSTTARNSRQSSKPRNHGARTRKPWSRRSHHREVDGPMPKRMSKYSVSSDSTKLGEVRRRRSRRESDEVAFSRRSVERVKSHRDHKTWWKQIFA